jgi:hypothetical protein
MHQILGQRVAGRWTAFLVSVVGMFGTSIQLPFQSSPAANPLTLRKTQAAASNRPFAIRPARIFDGNCRAKSETTPKKKRS